MAEDVDREYIVNEILEGFSSPAYRLCGMYNDNEIYDTALPAKTRKKKRKKTNCKNNCKLT